MPVFVPCAGTSNDINTNQMTFLTAWIPTVFSGIWLQMKNHVILSQISFSWKHCTFHVVTSFCSDCSRSNCSHRSDRELCHSFWMNLEPALGSMLHTNFKWLHCEKCPPDAEKHIQGVLRSAAGSEGRPKEAGATLRVLGAHGLWLSPAGLLLSPLTRTRGFEVSWLMTTPLAKRSAEVSPWSAKLR